MVIDKDNPKFNEFQQIKREFFALRNGVVADVLRRGGCPCPIIFGLTVSQIIEVAAGIEKNSDLASRLWHNSSTRESMLLAPMVWPHGEVDYDLAVKLLAEAPSPEIADVLCHRLLRHLPFAMDVALYHSASDSDMVRYGALRLAFNLLRRYKDKAVEIARRELDRNCRLTSAVARSLVEEADYI